MDPMQFVGETTPSPAAAPAATIPAAGGVADPLSFMADAAPAMGGEIPAADAMGGAGGSGGYGGFEAGAFDGLPLATDGGMGRADMGGEYGGSMIPEATPLREWEDEHERNLEDHSRKEDGERSERKDKAAAEVKAWYEEQKIAFEKRKIANRTEEQEFIAIRDAGLKGNIGNPWERVVTLIDTTSRAGSEKDEKDLARMKNLIIQLKSNPPGSSTYA